MKLVTAKQMTKIDKAAIEDYGIAGVVLMENAGRAVSEAVMALVRDLQAPSPTVLIIAGPGNNGGDGFVAARHLQRLGVEARVCLLCKADELKGDARVNYKVAARCGVPIDENACPNDLALDVALSDLLVDAILGTGARGELGGAFSEAVRIINASGKPVLAVDIPTGIDADTGQVMGTAVQATATVTFGLPKVGLYCYPGRAHCGEIRIAEIGLPAQLIGAEKLSNNLTTLEEARQMLPARWPEMHKGDSGRLLVVAGSAGMTGAAALSAMGALRAGAGLVTLACPASISDILEVKCTEAIVLPLPETDRRTLSSEAVEPLMAAAEGSDAVAIGPGLGRGSEVRKLVRELIARIERPLVLDADGLNACAKAPEAIHKRAAPTIITPHAGELARLLDSMPEQVQASRLAAAREAAEKLDCAVLLKGAGTMVAAPNGETWLNPTGNEGMASGGIGDVLTGIVGAFMAGGAAPLHAGSAAAFYHGLAGDIAAERGGKRGLIASDLLEALPAALER